LQPSKQPFNLPTSPISSQTSQILCSVFAVTAVWGDQFNSIAPQSGVQSVGVVGAVADQILWSFWDNHLDEGGLGMLGSDKSRGYCLEMICADFLAGVQIENGGPDSLLNSVIRLFQLAPADQQREFLAKIHVAA
jgi:hypothetical protein